MAGCYPQMAPTSLVGQKTKTSPYGRKADEAGFPIKACELINTLEAPVYIERVSVHDVSHILKAKRAIKKGLGAQLGGKGYSFIEVLATCPTSWGMSPVEANKWVESHMIPQYPLGVLRDRLEDA